MMHEFDKNNSAYESFKWLMTVQSPKSETRPHLKYIIVKDGWAHKTDSMILKSIKADGLANGCYSTIKANGVVIIKHEEGITHSDRVDFDSIYSDCDRYAHKLDDYQKYARSDENNVWYAMSELIAKTQQANTSAMTINGLLFNEMFNGFDGEILFDATDKAVYFKGESMKGLVMPLYNKNY